MHQGSNLSGAFAACTLLALAARALAASPEADETAERISSDPTFLPRANQFYGETSYSYASTDFDEFFLSGAPLGTRKSNTSSVEQLVGYGVTDEFTVRLMDTYVRRGLTINSAGTGRDTSLEASGFDNPTLSGTWRAIDQRIGAPVSVDVTLAYSPNWISSEIAAVDKNGTIGSGRQIAFGKLAVGRVSSRFTVSGQVEARYFGTRDSENLNNGSTAREDPYWDYTLSVLAQVPLGRKVLLNGGYLYTITGTENIRQEFSGLTGHTVGGNYGDLGLALNYTFVNHRLVGQLGFDNIQYERATTTYSFAPSSFFTGSRSVNRFVVRLYYAF